MRIKGICATLRQYLSTDSLREKRTRGEGVKKAGKSAYVLNGCSLIQKSEILWVQVGLGIGQFHHTSGAPVKIFYTGAFLVK